jgi:hypothetical protein
MQLDLHYNCDNGDKALQTNTMNDKISAITNVSNNKNKDVEKPKFLLDFF